MLAEHSDEPSISHQHVGRRQVTLADAIPIDLRQRPQVGPHRARTYDVQQAFALSEADLHPLVVVAQLTASALAIEPSPSRVGAPQSGNEGGEVRSELD